MATITSAGSGNWSAGGTWVGSTVPASSDDAVIASTHTVTLDTTGCVAKSITINSGGTLTNTTGAAWDVTVGNVTGDTANIVLNSGGTLNLDMSAVPAYAGTVYLNKGGNAAGLGIQTGGTSTFSLKGAVRKRWTRLNGAIAAGATSAVVDDASGWRVGDRIIFGTTQPYNATPRIDEVILTSISGVNIGWTGGITYDHADNGYVGNFSSNLTISRYGTNLSYVAADNYGTRIVQDVAFWHVRSGIFAKYGLALNSGGASTINNNALYETQVFLRFLGGIATRQDNVFYGPTQSPIGGQSAPIYVGDWERFIVFRSNSAGLSQFNPGEKFVDSVAMACASYGASAAVYGQAYEGCSLVANASGIGYIYGATGYLQIEGSEIGTEFGAHNNICINFADGAYRVVAEGCNFQTGGTYINALVNAAKPLYVGVDAINKNGAVTSQELFYPHAEIKRHNSETKRSTSSISIKPTLMLTDAQRTQQILCADSASIRVVGNVKADTAFYNGGGSNWTPPTVTISGNGIAPMTFTASSAANNTWEQFDLTATNGSGVDGNFTLTYTANAKSVTTGTVYFDGVPDAPFITKCRHYGFLFDESSSIRTVDPYASVSEAAAMAYTGVTINGVANRITFGTGTADTAQKFYDYSRAWCCLNLAQQVPFTRAGALFSLTTGWTIVDPTITGMTWQGGTVEFSTTGSKAISVDGSSLTFATAGTYSFAASSLAGTVELINTSGGAVVVNVPGGTSVTNTGPNITVNELQTTLTITGFQSGSDIVIYNTNEPDGTGSNILASGDGVTGTFEYQYSGTPTVHIGAFKQGYKPKMYRNTVLPSTSSNFTVQQEVDRSYT